MLDVAAFVFLDILDKLSEVIVGEGGLGSVHHFGVGCDVEFGCARHEPKVLHVVLVASVDDRVVFIVGVNDLVVGLVVVLLEEEFDEALAFTELGCVFGAVGIAVHAETRTEEATFT